MFRKNRFIYVLKDGRDGVPFYVGSGVYGDRPTQHVELALGKSTFRRNAEHESMYKFIQEIAESGNEVKVEIPHDDLPYEEAMKVEESLTREIGTQYDGNGPLFNVKYGNKFPKGFRAGERNSFYGKSHSIETLEKLRTKRSKTWTCSEETKAKRSKNHRGPTSVKLFDKDMNFISEFTQIKKCAEYLRETHPELPFSNTMVNAYSKSGKLMNELYHIVRQG